MSLLFYQKMQVLYEDNHIIIVNKAPSEIVQGDKTGDEPLSETIQKYLKERNEKLGNVVFMGMGEPFLNYDNVMEAVNILNSSKGQNFSKRNY